MQLLIDKGDFEIIAHPENAEAVIKKCGGTCYQSEQRTTKSPEEFVKMLRKRGHWSMFDHVSATVWFKNVSRGFTHEMVRHRPAAYAQESTRYVDPTEDPVTGEPGKVNLKVVGPPHKELDQKFYVTDLPFRQDAFDHRLEERKDFLCDYNEYSFKDMAETIEQYYKVLRKQGGWAQEDARQILPIGTKSDIIVTADFTEWRHIFRLRTQKAAHWEIRTVMCKVLEAFKHKFPTTFEDFIPAGVDKNGVTYYKIKGFVDDMNKFFDKFSKEFAGSNKSLQVQLSNSLKEYHNQNY